MDFLDPQFLRIGGKWELGLPVHCVRCKTWVKLPTSGLHVNFITFFQNTRNIALNPTVIVVYVGNLKETPGKL